MTLYLQRIVFYRPLDRKKRMEKVRTGKAGAPQEEKAALRKRILNERNALSPGQRKIWDEQIFRRLVQIDKAFPCLVYLCFVSYKSEVSTKEFILWCLENGKTVFVPKVMERKEPKAIRMGNVEAENVRTKDMVSSIPEKAEIRDMEFYQIAAWEELKAGYQGILEPKALPEKSFSEWVVRSGIFGQFAGARRSATADREVTAEKIRMLLPGAVFDGQGNRIGYGGGFYDRWLAWWSHTAQGKQSVLEKIGLAYHIQMTDCIPAEAFDQKTDCVITDHSQQLTDDRRGYD